MTDQWLRQKFSLAQNRILEELRAQGLNNSRSATDADTLKYMRRFYVLEDWYESFKNWLCAEALENFRTSPYLDIVTGKTEENGSLFAQEGITLKAEGGIVTFGYVVGDHNWHISFGKGMDRPGEEPRLSIVSFEGKPEKLAALVKETAEAHQAAKEMLAAQALNSIAEVGLQLVKTSENAASEAARPAAQPSEEAPLQQALN